MESQEDRQDEETKGDEQKAIIAPLVLSHEQMEEVSRKLESLEEQVKRLQVRMVLWMAELDTVNRVNDTMTITINFQRV